jgi:hypothetical protein
MSCQDPYCHIEAFVEQDQIDWMRDGVLCQLVTVMMVDDTGEVEPAACPLTAEQARALAFELLAAAEHADRLTRHRETER